MEKDTKKMTVFELTEAIVPYIESKRYSKSYVAGLRQTFDRLNGYCKDRGILLFSTELGQKFLYECYGITQGTVERRLSRAHRAVDMLLDFQLFGAVMVKRRLDRKFPAQFAEQAESYLSHMERNYAQPNTVLSHKKSLLKFTDFLDSVNIRSCGDITLEHANTYIKTALANYCKGSATLHMRIMKRFLKYLFDSEVLKEDISQRLITVTCSVQPAHLPTTLPIEDIEKILSCVDRESPMGKRDYAILSLAYRLGLRASDIRNLKPSSLDWENHEIHITQVKTKEPLTLPLPSDVGWALIDYLKNARPVSDRTEIFLTVVAPYEPLANPDNVLVRYMRLAGIQYTKLKHHGLHTLRHSLATHMLEQEIPITTIQGVLGHVNSETTQKYIAINISQLKECGLEVPSL